VKRSAKKSLLREPKRKEGNFLEEKNPAWWRDYILKRD